MIWNLALVAVASNLSAVQRGFTVWLSLTRRPSRRPTYAAHPAAPATKRARFTENDRRIGPISH